MKVLRRIILWLVLGLVLLLMVLTVVGACKRAEWAGEFFNSWPLEIFWLTFVGLLAIGFTTFGRLRYRPGLLLVHAGCLVILVSSMGGSEKGHAIRRQLLNRDKVREGYMVIYEGQGENRIQSKQNDTVLGQLPFEVYLHDFRMEHYEWSAGVLYIQDRSGRIWQMVDNEGEQLQPGEDYPGVKILRRFRNFKVGMGDHKVTDNPEAGAFAALEIELKDKDGNVDTFYVFEQLPDRDFSAAGLRYVYASGYRGVKDYFSDLSVRQGDREMCRKEIEVNKPLHWGGYHFYQSDWDKHGGKYTVLSVVSDAGSSGTYAGFFLLGLGVFWQCWLRYIPRYIRSRYGNFH